MPEDMPDRMPNRMSEDMSDRMPEDVPVRTCINVMVGITRSKVFLLGFLVMFLQTNSQPCHDLECDIHWHTKRNKNLMPFFGRLFSHTMPYMPLNLVITGNLYLRRFFSPLSTRSAHLSRSSWSFWRPWSGSLWPRRHAHSPGLTAWMGHA